MSSDHTIRTEVRLSGSIPATFIMGKDLDGIYIGGDFQGVAQGWYDANVPGPVPDGYWQGGSNTGSPSDGVWSGGTNTGLADGWYQLNVRVTLQDGIWIGEAYHGVANGWYASNVPAPVPDGYWQGGVLGPVPDGYWSGGSIDTVPNGVWQGGTNTGLADGWYVANLPTMVPNGLWVGGVNTGPVGDGLWAGGANTGPLSDGIYVGQAFKEVATGYYDNNERAPIPDGCYRNGGLVDPYYEAIIKAAEAQGGGLYLFQLEHGQYAGEQVIWQEMGEINPWAPGQGLPQGKTYDLMGSGEYLGQSVSMRRPVDGVFDGINSFLVASSMAIGDVLHQYRGSAWVLGADLTPASQRRPLGTCEVNGANGIHVRTQPASTAIYRRKDTAYEGLPTITKNVDDYRVMGVVVNAVGSMQPVVDGALFGGATTAPSPYPDKPADALLHVGSSPGGGIPCPGTYQYIAIYTREPTPYEISLHKRTP